MQARPTQKENVERHKSKRGDTYEPVRLLLWLIQIPYVGVFKI